MMTVAARTALAALVLVVGCLLTNSETHSVSNPPGEPKTSSGTVRAKVVKRIQLSAPGSATFGVWNADGSRIALGTLLHRSVGVFEFPSGQRLPGPADQPVGVQGLAYSPDGRYLAVARGRVGTGLDRFSISLWDARTSAHLENLVEPDAQEIPLLSLDDFAFSPDSRYLAVSYNASGLFLYEIDPARGSRRIARVGRSVARVAFSSDGTRLAASRGLGTTVHEVPTGRTVRAIPQGSSYSIAFRPDGRQMVMSRGPVIRIVETTGWQETAAFEADPPATVQAVWYTPDGRYLVVGVGRVVQLWSVETNARLTTLTDHGPRLINTVALSPNGRFIAAFGGDIVTIWELLEI